MNMSIGHSMAKHVVVSVAYLFFKVIIGFLDDDLCSGQFEVT